MFFCSYGVLKDEWATDKATGKVEFWKVLVAGMGSGMGAGYLSTPMDVSIHSQAIRMLDCPCMQAAVAPVIF